MVVCEAKQMMNYRKTPVVTIRRMTIPYQYSEIKVYIIIILLLICMEFLHLSVGMSILCLCVEFGLYQDMSYSQILNPNLLISC